MGTLATVLPASSALCLEREAEFEIALANDIASLTSTTIAGLAAGANRMLIGKEIVQFLCAEPIDANRWRLSGLLRGRGGTEGKAANGHPIGTRAILIDDAISALDPSAFTQSGPVEFAAIGLGDPEPVYFTAALSGSSRLPLSPVHARAEARADGGWGLCWTRRSRGQWQWEDGIDTPLIEENEAYLVGCGPMDQPLISWETAEPRLALSHSEVADLNTHYGPHALWVKQIGTHGLSPATSIAQLT